MMALFDPLSTLLNAKTLAGVTAALTIAGSGVAGATGALPPQAQGAFDGITGASQDDEDKDDEDKDDEDKDDEDKDEETGLETESEDDEDGKDDDEGDEPEVEVAEEDDGGEGRSENATARLMELSGSECMPGDDGCHFGQLVSQNAPHGAAANAESGRANAEVRSNGRSGPKDDEGDESGSAEIEEPDGSNGPPAGVGKPAGVGR